MSTVRSNSFADQIRQAIDDSGETRYRIARGSGINERALSKFYHGHRGLSMRAMNALGEYLGLKIVTERNVERENEGP